MDCAFALLTPSIGIFFSLQWRGFVKEGRSDLFNVVRFWPLLLVVSVSGLVYEIVWCLGG